VCKAYEPRVRSGTMKTERRLHLAALWIGILLLLGCAGEKESPTPEWADLRDLADSITNTPMKSGRYALASEFFEKLAALRETEGADPADSMLFEFFSRLHPDVRINDSLAVLQLVEWMSNSFTQMDPGGVFFTNGDADTYAAWYLQRAEHVRPDLVVVSLPFLMGPDYRQFLLKNSHTQEALNLSKSDSLPAPPSTRETQQALREIVTRQISRPGHPPLYFAPICGIKGRFGGHIVDLGLVHAYQDSVQSQSQILDQLMFKLTNGWQLYYASQGMPQDTRYAARFPIIQYLTLLLRFLPEFEKQERHQDMDTLFTYLEPAVGEDWRFSMLRYMHCHQGKEDCLEYLERIKDYAAEHPDDRAVQAALNQLEGK
jgi:hypothetical protein